MKRIVAAAAIGLLACSDSPTAPVAFDGSPVKVGGMSSTSSRGGRVARVTTSADAGPGSFRQAMEDADSDQSIAAIRFDKGLAPIHIQRSLIYSGNQPLRIDAAGGEVDGSLLAPAQGVLIFTGGGDLVIRNLTVRDAPGVGITVQIPAATTGVVDVALDDVHALDNGFHGVLINDQTGYLTDPESTSAAGSDAALDLRIVASSFERNGFAQIDQDGLRVNEGGLGDLRASIRRTLVIANGGDGVELDERGPGSVIFSVEHTDLLRNGAFSTADLDDGIDVDEAGEGDIDGRFVQVKSNQNFEQGVDLNENDAGDLRIEMSNVEASDNAEEGIEFEEDDDFAGGGNIIARLRHIVTRRNGANDGDAGLKLREKGAGNLTARIVDATSSDNAIGGILIREDAAGDLTAVLVNAEANANGNHGIAFDENSAGNLDGRVQHATASNNTGAGVSADQSTPGTGTLRLQKLKAEGNGGGDVMASGVTVERVPAQ